MSNNKPITSDCAAMSQYDETYILIYAINMIYINMHGRSIYKIYYTYIKNEFTMTVGSELKGKVVIFNMIRSIWRERELNSSINF